MDEHPTIADLERRLAAAEAALRAKADVEVVLRQSEELRRIAVEGGRMGTWRWNMRDERVWGDAASLRLWGYPPSDEPRPLSDFTDRMSPQGRAEMGKMVTRAIASGEEFDGQLAVVSGPTHGHWVRWRGLAERERPWIVNGVSFDITDQRMRELRLRESEARHRLLIESWAQAVWETDPRGVVVADSPSWRAYTGQTLEEWRGYGWLDAIHPDDRAHAERQWRDAVAARGLVNAEFRLRAPTGGWRWTNVRAAPVLDAGGSIEKWAGMNIDIDARKTAEAALRESEARLRMMLQLVPALLWSADAEGRVVADRSWQRRTGQRAEEVRGFGWLDAIHPDEREVTRAAFAHAFTTGEPLERQQRIRQANGEHRWHLIRHVPVRDADGAITRWFGAAIEMHDLHELQRRQEVLVNELQHRARNLLGVVAAVADRTVKQGDSVEAFEERLQALSRAQGLLSRGGSDTVELRALVRAELAAHADGASERATISGPEVYLQARQVQNFALALHELTTNAVKYGALKVETGRLAVTWEIVLDRRERRRLALTWLESGVSLEPDRIIRRGYGTELIQEALPYALNATVDYALGSDGVRCRIEMPVS